MPSGSKLTWPLRRLLDPRFADVTHRVSGIAQELQSVRAEVGAVQGSIDGHAEAITEIAVHVGERLDRIDAAIERIERRLDAAVPPAS